VTSLEQQLHAAMDADDPAELARIEALLDAEDAATRDRLAQPGALLAAALYYVRRGWHVFPCKPGEKVPATRHGLHDATTDEEQVAVWWHDINPLFNIGLPTGTYFDVVDIDGHQGMQSLLAWCREEDTTTAELFNPRLGSVLTPRRPGTHIYTAPTGEGNRAGIRPGIDWRGQGGYVLAPPSRTEHGTYVWASPVAP
jgi:Bifunctional DNA primase/polymerase, N-terminal